MATIFFKSAAEFRKWLEKHHATADELWVGFHKKATGKPSLTWPESVEQALCFGWIDSIRGSLGATRYRIRFTPRRPGSLWSAVNIRHVRRLQEQGLMRPEGLAAFDARTENRSGTHSYEQRKPDLPEPYEKRLKENEAAWSFFQAQPPSYRKAIHWWIVSARREETRERRLARLIAESAKRRRLTG